MCSMPDGLSGIGLVRERDFLRSVNRSVLPMLAQALSTYFDCWRSSTHDLPALDSRNFFV